MTLDQLLRMEGPNRTPGLIADPLSNEWGLPMALDVQPTNNQFVHEINAVAEYGTVETRRINQGASIANPQTRKFTTRALYLEARLQIDELLLMGLPEEKKNFFRRERWMLTVEGMSQGIAKRLQYDNASDQTADSDGMQGLAARYDSPSMENVYDAGGTASGALTSVYIIETSPLNCYGIYLDGIGRRSDGKGGFGFDSQYKGLQTIWKDGKQFDADCTKIMGSCGLGIADDRTVQRICNIDSSLTGTKRLTDAAVLDLITYAKNKLPRKGMNKRSRAFLLVNSTSHAQLEIARSKAGNVDYKPVDWLGGNHALIVAGLPVVYDAGILDTESRVVA